MKRLRRWLWRWTVALLPIPIAALSIAAGRTSKHTVVFGHRVALATVLIVLVCVLLLVEVVAVARRERRFAQLREQEDRVSAAELVVLKAMRDELVRLEAKAHYFSEGRISLFRLDGNYFVLAARRSRMPDFDLSLGRARYPSHAGVLGAALRQQHAEERMVPDPGPPGNPVSDGWIQWQVNQGLPIEVAKALTMRSQNYVAFRLDLVDRTAGAIVFESTVSDREASAAGGSTAKRSIEDLRRLLTGGSQERLAQLLDNSCVMPADVLRERLSVVIDQRRKTG